MAQGPNYNIISPFSTPGSSSSVGTTTFTGNALFPAGGTTAPGVAIGTTSAGWFWNGTQLVAVTNGLPVAFLTGTPIADNTLGYQTDALGAKTFFAANSGGGYRGLFGYDSAQGGVVVRSVNAGDSLWYIVANSVIAAQFQPSGQTRQFKCTALTKTANYAVTTTDSYTTFDTVGAAGVLNFSLPTSAPGLQYTFYVGSANTITVTPQAGDTIKSGSKTAGQALNSSNTVGQSVTLIGSATANTWLATPNNGFS